MGATTQFHTRAEVTLVVHMLLPDTNVPMPTPYPDASHSLFAHSSCVAAFHPGQVMSQLQYGRCCVPSDVMSESGKRDNNSPGA